MATVSVTPQTFNFVTYDAGRIKEVASKLADDLGFGDAGVIDIEIEERTPLGRARIASLSPIRLHIEGGAIEDPTVPRTQSERLVADVVGRLLLRARDRLDPDFGQPPPDEELTLQQQTAWDAYCMGRLERLGYDARRPRRQYHFRNRHGFNDVADRVFTRLWSSESLSWGEIEAACAETAAVKVAP